MKNYITCKTGVDALSALLDSHSGLFAHFINCSFVG